MAILVINSNPIDITEKIFWLSKVTASSGGKTLANVNGNQTLSPDLQIIDQMVVLSYIIDAQGGDMRISPWKTLLR
jgi:hypothetical protein